MNSYIRDRKRMISSAVRKGSNEANTILSAVMPMLEANLSTKTAGIIAHSFARRRAEPAAALKAGLLAGAFAFVVLQFIGVVIYDESPWKLLRMIAALARGPGVLEPDDEFDAPVALVGITLFFAISLLYSLAFCMLVADAPRRHAIAMGLAFGIALYFANYHGFTAIFPWFAPLRTFDTLVVHALFGVAIAKGYWFFRRR
jgi:hypothetical protein